MIPKTLQQATPCLESVLTVVTILVVSIFWLALTADDVDIKNMTGNYDEAC